MSTRQRLVDLGGQAVAIMFVVGVLCIIASGTTPADQDTGGWSGKAAVGAYGFVLMAPLVVLMAGAWVRDRRRKWQNPTPPARIQDF